MREYVTYFKETDGGQLELTSATKQFIIPAGSLIKFRLRMGSPFAQNPTLLVNLPLKASSDVDGGQSQAPGSGETSTGQQLSAMATAAKEAPRYTMTQPIGEDGTQKDMGAGWALSTSYLARVSPSRLTVSSPAQTYHEFAVAFPTSGSFFVQLEYASACPAEEAKGERVHRFTQPSYINVEPVLQLGPFSPPTKCKELSICTVVSRCLGPIGRWHEVLEPLSKQKYNAVHFTPIQQYGQSMSHYSIADQTEFADYYFASAESAFETAASLSGSSQASPNKIVPSKLEKFEQVKAQVDAVRERLQMFAIVDIVLNHTANNSAWIQAHPEACYNTDDVPRLYPAYLLDAELLQVSRDFARGRVSWCPSAPRLNNEHDLGQVVEEMRKRVYRLNLHEFFLGALDREAFLASMQGMGGQAVQAQVEAFRKKGLFSKDPFAVLQEHFLDRLAHGPQRKQVGLKFPEGAIFFTYLNNQNVSRAMDQVDDLMRRSNEHWTHKINQEWIPEAMECCRGTMRYFKLQLRRNLINEKNYLLDPYFSLLQNPAQSKVVHNGWIGDQNPLEDFAQETNFSYLRRQVNIWGDSIKLRYGKCPADSPFLWSHMSDYVAQMATVFDGFRLDNAHSTPMHVCQYMLQVARSFNKNLMVMAELFTSSAELDALFTSRLNINGMIREIMNKGDVWSVGAYFHEVTCHEAVLGKLDQAFEQVEAPKEDGVAKTYEILRPAKPSDIIYDMTHDNPSPLEKFGSRRLALPTLGLLGLADQIIATTWGYDQLLPENLSIVKEARLYPIEESTEDAWVLPVSTGGGQRPASPIEYVFRYQGRGDTQSVVVAGEFTGWTPQVRLQRGRDNQWTGSYFVPQGLQGKKVQFKFVVNSSEWCLNDSLPKTDDGTGNVNNFFEAGQARPEFVGPPHRCTKMQDMRVPRMLMNFAHAECTANDAEIFMHSQTDDTIVVVRQLSLNFSDEYDAYVTVNRFPFQGCDMDAIQTVVELPGTLTSVIFCANMVDGFQIPAGGLPKSVERFVTSPASEVYMHNSLEPFARVVSTGTASKLEFFNMPQAFTCLLRTRCQPQVKDAIGNLDQVWSTSAQTIARTIAPRPLTLAEINHVLFRCDNEEKDITQGRRGCYGLPDRGQFVYAGLQSLMDLFQKLKLSGDMGDALLDNVRQGDWLMDYTLERIASQKQEMPSLHGIEQFLRDVFMEVKQLPVSFKPRYVCRVVEKVFNALLSLVISSESNLQAVFAETPDPFLQQMVLAIVQMYARVPSAQFGHQKDAMCAGLPHFSTGYMRCWGRDTFIALRGLLLTTGRFQEAKDTIIFFARVERHGLIPNLHDQGNNTRFNARDATWFFLQAVKDYVTMADDGISILQETFRAQFDNQRETTLLALVIKILQAHASGIDFREWNAGPRIDEQMKDNGFNIRIYTDLAQSGFCFGGNEDNCGTWMDKMGSAPGNKGVPATPRDGAPVELVGLQYSVLSFLAKLHDEGKIMAAGVREITFEDWAAKIKANFSKFFYVPLADSSDYHTEARLVNRRGIYKDTFRSSHGYTDYQLRPNLCVAMAVAPELFNPQQAHDCLKIVEQVLLGPKQLGMKTLDPDDLKYRGDYDNDDESRGHNYHQGPEWVWPLGYFLIAKLHFMGYAHQLEAAQDIMRHLLPHQAHMLKEDEWHSLPELTNSNGSHCHHSCPAQAWSIGTLLDALHQLRHYGIR